MEEILVVEDDRELQEGLVYMLEKEGFCTRSACSVREAEKQFGEAKGQIGLVLLDVNLPDGEGYTFLSRIRKKSQVPVLFLTARDMEEDALKGYEMGAEDYITKPFSMKILLKKINVALRRGKEENRQIFDDGYLFIDFERAKVTVKGEECVITPTEFRFLREFTLHKGQLLTYEVLLERLWDGGSQFVERHALAVNINRLRKKIEDEEHSYILNVYGMGYQWLG